MLSEAAMKRTEDPKVSLKLHQKSVALNSFSLLVSSASIFVMVLNQPSFANHMVPKSLRVPELQPCLLHLAPLAQSLVSTSTDCFRIESASVVLSVWTSTLNQAVLSHDVIIVEK